MEEQEQYSLPGVDHRLDFTNACYMVGHLAAELRRMEELMDTGIFNQDERDFLAELWESLT